MARGRPRKTPAALPKGNSLVQQLRKTSADLKGSGHAIAAAAAADRIEVLEQTIQLAIGALAAKL